MSEPQDFPPVPMPATASLLRRPGMPPWRVAVMLALLLVSSFFCSEFYLGRLDGNMWLENGHDLRIGVFHCLAFAYVIGAWLGVRAALARLDGELAGAGSVVAWRPQIGWQIFGALLGLGISLIGPFLTAHPSNPWAPSGWRPEVAWHRVLSVPLGVILGCLLTRVAGRGLQFGAIAHDLPLAGVFDRQRVDALGRAALAMALWAAGFFVVTAMLLIERDHWIHFLILTPLLAVNASLALAPVFLQWHRRIVALKAVETAHLAATLARLHAQLLDPDAAPSPGRYADVSTALARVAAVPDWPIDRDSGIGVALLLAMPALSALISVLRDHAMQWIFG